MANTTIEFPQEFFDMIRDAVYEGMKKYYIEIEDKKYDCCNWTNGHCILGHKDCPDCYECDDYH